MLRVAIIGAGRIGRVHAESVASHPKATLVAVCDPMGTAAEDLAAYVASQTLEIVDLPAVTVRPEVEDMKTLIGVATLASQIAR